MKVLSSDLNYSKRICSVPKQLKIPDNMVKINIKHNVFIRTTTYVKKIVSLDMWNLVHRELVFKILPKFYIKSTQQLII